MRIALVYVPVPRYPLSEAERHYGSAFFQTYAKTYFKHLSTAALKQLWQLERVNQGLLYIASNLLEHGFEVSHYAYSSNPYASPVDGTSVILNELMADIDEVDLVCMHSITCNYHVAESIASRLKARKPKVVIGLGGPHASAVPFQVLNECTLPKESPSDHSKYKPPFDFVGIGESEKTVLEVARCLRDKGRLEPVAGTVVRTNGVVVSAQRRERANPVEFPIPAYELAGIEQLPAARIFPNRGCPNSCAFCADPWSKKVTYVTLDRLSEEVDLLYSHFGTRYLYLGCEDFLCDENRAREIGQTLYATRPDIKWVAQCRAKPEINTKTMNMLVQCGCIGLEFGVESADQSILERVNKNIRVEDAKECFEFAKSYGLHTHAYWMLGLPGENVESAGETMNTMLEWADKGLVDTWEYKMYIPYPGTPIYVHPDRYGIRILSHDYRDYHYALDPVISTNGLDPSELRSIHQKGLSLSADLMRSKLDLEELEIGVDLETIENMF